jgi:hypothetical protein
VRNKVHKFCAILILTLAPAAVGCAARHLPPKGRDSNDGLGHNEHNYEKDRENSEKDPTVLQFCLDPDGHPYPDPRNCRIDDSDLRDCNYCVEKCVGRRGVYDADRICEEFSRRIGALCHGGRTLIVLIHGISMTYPEIHRCYKLARIQFERLYPGRKFSFLEVYWDGMCGDAFAIWPPAQRHSKWAGLGLRNLLCRLDPALPIRVLTHSRGASVICAALWNTPMRSKAEEDDRYLQAQRALPPPALPKLRLGLLAPAMRAADFECYFDRGGAAAVFHDRIVIGFNPDDNILQAGGFSWLVGCALGCSPDLFDSCIAPLLNRGRTRAFAVDFSGSAWHSFQDYLLRDVFEEVFLPRLLDEDQGELVTGN